MTMAPVDTRFALDAANSSDLVQKKLSIDAMRKRVSGGPDEEKKLRDACEGFESVFLQRMWEQMRKNVKKEGYLHSKDEEAYQSMFDTELAKKMSSAGGIGLADMLYEQLSQKLTATSSSTHPMSAPLPIEPARAPRVASAASAPAAPMPALEELYSEVPESPDAEVEEAARQAILADALAEIEASYDPALDEANATYPMFDLQHGLPQNPVAGRIREETGVVGRDMQSALPLDRVSAPGKERPSRSGKGISRTARGSRQAKEAERAQSTAAARNPSLENPEDRQRMEQVAPVMGVSPVTPERSVSANGSHWPVDGELVSGYGRHTGPNGESVWNTGVEFAIDFGAPVVAPIDGTVAFSGERHGVQHIVLQHDNGLSSYYDNVATTLRPGDVVEKGMKFASVVSSVAVSEVGAADSAARMRFEIRRGELAINPERALA